MTPNDSPDVLAYRARRMRNAPRNWCYWVAGFTAANGVLSVAQPDMLVLAGLVAPFLATGPAWHFGAAAALAALAYFGQSRRLWLGIAGVVYVVDTLLAAYLQLWSGVAMHAVVLVLVGLALNGARLLAKQSAAGVARGGSGDGVS